MCRVVNVCFSTRMLQIRLWTTRARNADARVADTLRLRRPRRYFGIPATTHRFVIMIWTNLRTLK